MIWRIIPNWHIKAKRRIPTIWQDFIDFVRYGQDITPETRVIIRSPQHPAWHGGFFVLARTHNRVLIARPYLEDNVTGLQWTWIDKDEIEVIE